MSLSPFRFDRFELAGSFGDLGTLIPLTIGVITLNGLSATTVFLAVGLFYVAAGLFYRLPMPVQPLKLVAAIAIASATQIGPQELAAAGVLMGLILLLMSWSRIIDPIARLFAPPIVKGIQLGLGLILITKGVAFIAEPVLFVDASQAPSAAGISANTVIGASAAVITLLVLSNRKLPAALVLLGLGIITGAAFGQPQPERLTLGPTPVEWGLPNPAAFVSALVLLVIPQLPLTLGNAVIGTRETARELFGPDQAARVSDTNLARSMGVANLVGGLVAAMPMCHGAGGLAAHYRFGARTGGSNLLIGGLFVLLALGLGAAAVQVLGAVPKGVLGTLLLFAGLELALLIRGVGERTDLFMALLIAGVALATQHMGIACGVGIGVHQLIKRTGLQL